MDGHDHHNADADRPELPLGAALQAACGALRAVEPADLHMGWRIPPAVKQLVVDCLLRLANHPHDLDDDEDDDEPAAPTEGPRPVPAEPAPPAQADAAALPAPQPRAGNPPPPRAPSRTITLRHSIRAMGLLAALGDLNIRQQRLDRRGLQHAAAHFRLSDVTRAAAAQRDAQEDYARRCAAAEAAGLPLPEPPAEPEAPPPPPPQPGRHDDPALRQDWPIPVAARDPLVARLADIIDPQGRLGRHATPGDVLLAVRTLQDLGRQAEAQRRLDLSGKKEKVVDIDQAKKDTIARAEKYFDKYPEQRPKTGYFAKVNN